MNSLFRFSIRMVLLAFFTTSVAAAQTVVDTILVMSDGARIDALYVLPTTARPAAGYPAVLLVHGFAGSKNNNRSDALAYARAGYAATAYSVRGQGASEGLFDFFASPRILADLRAAVDFTRRLRGVDSSRVAVVGGSQGGLHAWNAAAYGMGARCVVSLIANARFDENFLENDALNWTFAAATMTTDVRFEPGISSMFRQAREGGDFSVLGPFFRDQSTIEQEASVTTPTAIAVSYYDGFFNQNAALRQFASVTAPKRIILYPGGHSLPSDPAQSSYVRNFIDRWLAFWLKDDPSHAAIASPDSAVMFFDAGSGTPRVYLAADSAQWLRTSVAPPAEMQRLDLFFSPEGLAFTAPTQRSERSITYINVLGSTPISFRTPPLDRDVRILPRAGEALLRTRGSAAPHQMNVFLYDVDASTGRRQPLSRGHRQSAAANVEQSLQFDLTASLHTVRSGHQIEAVVSGGLPLFPDQGSVFGNFVLGPVVASLNAFVLGGDEASRISFFVEADGTSASEAPVQPSGMRLLPAWPNPAGAWSTISFELSAAAHVRLTLHDAMGRELAVIAEGAMQAGTQRVHLITSEYRSGIYFYRLTAAGRSEAGRLHVLH